MSEPPNSTADDAPIDAREVVSSMVRAKQESISREVVAHRQRSLSERVELVREASALGMRLFALNPNRERVLAARERENDAFAELCRRIAAREQA